MVVFRKCKWKWKMLLTYCTERCIFLIQICMFYRVFFVFCNFYLLLLVIILILSTVKHIYLGTLRVN